MFKKGCLANRSSLRLVRSPLRNPSEVTPLRNPWVPQGRDFASNPRVAHSCESQEDVGHKTAEQFSTALRWGCRRWSQPCRGSGPRTCGPGSICWPGPSRCGQPAQVTAAAAGQNRHHLSAVRRDNVGFFAPSRPPPHSHALTAAHPVFAQDCASMRWPVGRQAPRARGRTHVKRVQLGEHGG